MEVYALEVDCAVGRGKGSFREASRYSAKQVAQQVFGLVGYLRPEP